VVAQNGYRGYHSLSIVTAMENPDCAIYVLGQPTVVAQNGYRGCHSLSIVTAMENRIRATHRGCPKWISWMSFIIHRDGDGKPGFCDIRIRATTAPCGTAKTAVGCPYVDTNHHNNHGVTRTAIRIIPIITRYRSGSD
jgi:hypothetical protein